MLSGCVLETELGAAVVTIGSGLAHFFLSLCGPSKLVVAQNLDRQLTMNGTEVLRIVDSVHRDKGIEEEVVFGAIEAAVVSAAHKHYGEESAIDVDIDRGTGEISAKVDGTPLDSDELGDLLGRIAAQTAKQVMIQKIREAERDTLFDEFEAQRGEIVTGTITRVDHGVATVNLGKVEAILPRSEMIPGEQHRVNERVRASVLEVRKQGSRVKVVLSRSHPELVRRLFEVEIPEVAEGVIEVRSLSREAGYRSKVAVSCYDSSIDAVGACVGVRGARIRNIVDELAGERIDIIRWNDSLQVLIPNAMQPAEVDDVILCPMLGRVIVLVREDQLSLAIGKKGQNVRLASKLVGWDIEVMTQEELDQQLENTFAAFSTVPNVSEELAEALVSQGFFSFEDLSVIEPDQLQEMSGLTEEQCDEIVTFADEQAEREEREQEERRKQDRERRQMEAVIEAAKVAEATGEGLTPEQASGRAPLPKVETDDTAEKDASEDGSSDEEAVASDDSSDEQAEDASNEDASADEPSADSTAEELKEETQA